MTSEDSGFTWSPITPAYEAMCRENGIAHFYRTWTATDKWYVFLFGRFWVFQEFDESSYTFSPGSGNFDTFTQKIIIEHPPEFLAPTAVLSDGVYSYSPGVVQSQDPCVPGKHVSLGPKEYAAEYNFTVVSDVCQSAEWDENGCRLWTNIPFSVEEVLSVAPGKTVLRDAYRYDLLEVLQTFLSRSQKPFPRISMSLPVFVSFPAHTTVNTKQSINPENTGYPVGAAFCNTPFEIVHRDPPAVLVSCGVWEIHRVWTIRPVSDFSICLAVLRYPMAYPNTCSTSK